RPGGRYTERLVGAAESGEIAGVKLFCEGACCGLRIEMPGRPQPQRPLLEPGRSRKDGRSTVGRQQLRRTEPLDLRLERRGPGGFHDAEPARRQIQPRETEAAVARAHAG